MTCHTCKQTVLALLHMKHLTKTELKFLLQCSWTNVVKLAYKYSKATSWRDPVLVVLLFLSLSHNASMGSSFHMHLVLQDSVLKVIHPQHITQYEENQKKWTFHFQHHFQRLIHPLGSPTVCLLNFPCSILPWRTSTAHTTTMAMTSLGSGDHDSSETQSLGDCLLQPVISLWKLVKLRPFSLSNTAWHFHVSTFSSSTPCSLWWSSDIH